MKVLQICHKMPFPLLDGGSFSIYHSAKGLVSNGVELKMLAVCTPKCQEAAHETIPGLSSFDSVQIDTRLKPLKLFMNLFGKNSYFVERFWSKQFRDKLIDYLKKDQFDVIQLEHLYMCLYLESIRKHSNAKIILRPQNIEVEIWKEYLRNSNNPFLRRYLTSAVARLNRFEHNVVKKVDAIIAISENDAEKFRELTPHVPVSSIPCGLEVNNTFVKNKSAEFPRFYHIGSMDWRPNLQGIDWFLKDIFPYIREKVPDFTFRIAGKNMPSALQRKKILNLIIDGQVESACKYHQMNDIMIVPLLSGSGIRIKILEAMACGNVVISTDAGARGIDFTSGRDLLIANNKEEFADAIDKCIREKEYGHAIGMNAQKLVRERYDLNILGRQMLEFYKQWQIN